MNRKELGISRHSIKTISRIQTIRTDKEAQKHGVLLSPEGYLTAYTTGESSMPIRNLGELLIESSVEETSPQRPTTS